MKPIFSLNIHKKYLSIKDIHPNDLASQLTLIDLPIFKSIAREELIRSSSCEVAVSTVAKQQSQCHNNNNNNICPNLLAMKRQFNQLTFWVVGQILAYDSPQQRAELLSYFIKTAKRLYRLNNLHSSNAIVSALLSSPIYRLEKSWNYLNKKYPKDKIQYDKLRQLFSDTNNYEALRKHLNNCDLPCIPYLGLYSRDIIYLKEAHQKHEMQRTKSTSKILDFIEKFQSSSYNDLVPMQNVQYVYLLSSRYLDELQTFLEDANYRRSLELEPSSPYR